MGGGASGSAVVTITQGVATVGGVQMEVLWSLHLKEQVSLDDIYMKELCFLHHRKTQTWVVVQVGVLWSLLHRMSRS